MSATYKSESLITVFAFYLVLQCISTLFYMHLWW